jgi:hypothetical protein
MARTAAAALAVAALARAGVTERTATTSLAVLGHLHWICLTQSRACRVVREKSSPPVTTEGGAVRLYRM